jgi:hypothetical protein
MRTLALHRHSDHRVTTLTKAWLWLVAIPFAFVAGMVAGEGLITAMGYDFAGEEPVPLGPAALVGIPITLLVAVPAVMAYRVGMRAKAEGDPRGLIPALFGAIGATFFVLTNLAGLVLGR